jgi:hypothetical protein
VKFAFLPLGFGSTNIRAPCTAACWNPGLMAGAWVWPRILHNARYIVTPTNATIAGRYFAIFCSRIRQPSTYSTAFSTSMPGLGRATRFVIPMPHCGSRTSSTWVTGSGTTPDSYNSRQKRFVGPAK